MAVVAGATRGAGRHGRCLGEDGATVYCPGEAADRAEAARLTTVPRRSKNGRARIEPWRYRHCEEVDHLEQEVITSEQEQVRAFDGSQPDGWANL